MLRICRAMSSSDKGHATKVRLEITFTEKYPEEVPEVEIKYRYDALAALPDAYQRLLREPSAYALAMHCPVLTERMVLPATFSRAMPPRSSGTLWSRHAPLYRGRAPWQREQRRVSRSIRRIPLYSPRIALYTPHHARQTRTTAASPHAPNAKAGWPDAYARGGDNVMIT
eukprot:2788288-Rhodomonas_salina.3